MKRNNRRTKYNPQKEDVKQLEIARRRKKVVKLVLDEKKNMREAATLLGVNASTVCRDLKLILRETQGDLRTYAATMVRKRLSDCDEFIAIVKRKIEETNLKDSALGSLFLRAIAEEGKLYDMQAAVYREMNASESTEMDPGFLEQLRRRAVAESSQKNEGRKPEEDTGIDSDEEGEYMDEEYVADEELADEEEEFDEAESRERCRRTMFSSGTECMN